MAGYDMLRGDRSKAFDLLDREPSQSPTSEKPLGSSAGGNPLRMMPPNAGVSLIAYESQNRGTKGRSGKSDIPEDIQRELNALRNHPSFGKLQNKLSPVLDQYEAAIAAIEKDGTADKFSGLFMIVAQLMALVQDESTTQEVKDILSHLLTGLLNLVGKRMDESLGRSTP